MSKVNVAKLLVLQHFEMKPTKFEKHMFYTIFKRRLVKHLSDDMFKINVAKIIGFTTCSNTRLLKPLVYQHYFRKCCRTNIFWGRDDDEDDGNPDDDDDEHN